MSQNGIHKEDSSDSTNVVVISQSNEGINPISSEFPKLLPITSSDTKGTSSTNSSSTTPRNESNRPLRIFPIIPKPNDSLQSATYNDKDCLPKSQNAGYFDESMRNKQTKKPFSAHTDHEIYSNEMVPCLTSAPIPIIRGENDLTTERVSTNKRDISGINLPRKILVVPRMTSSDSKICTNTKYFEDVRRNFIVLTDAECRQNREKSEEVTFVLKKTMNVESEQTFKKSVLPPVRLFETENYSSFSDSNTPEEAISLDKKQMKKLSNAKPEQKKGTNLKNNSLVSVSSTVCRICHSNTATERLLSPCYCKGSLAYVHLTCLERWLNQSSRSYCELCLYQYNAIETLRYGLFEGIRLWVGHPRNRNHVRSDCLIAFLLTLVTLGLVVICLIGMDYFMIEGIKLGFSRMWTKSFIVSFLGVIMMGYIVTMYLIAKDQFVPWYTWWKNTLNIRLLLSPAVLQTQRL